MARGTKRLARVESEVDERPGYAIKYMYTSVHERDAWPERRTRRDPSPVPYVPSAKRPCRDAKREREPDAVKVGRAICVRWESSWRDERRERNWDDAGLLERSDGVYE